MTYKNKSVQCNCCGKEIEKIDGRNMPDYLKVDKIWGYFSNKDLTKHSFALCETCYDTWIRTFVIPVKEEETTDVFQDIVQG